MKRLLPLLSCALTLTGCAYFQPAPPPPPPPVQHASLTRSLDLVDSAGTHYGHLELEPFGGGKLIDADGKVIGRIVPPEGEAPAPTLH